MFLFGEFAFLWGCGDEVGSAVGGGGGVGSLKNPGWGKKNASVYDAFKGVPTCICRANLLNWS